MLENHDDGFSYMEVELPFKVDCDIEKLGGQACYEGGIQYGLIVATIAMTDCAFFLEITSWNYGMVKELCKHFNRDHTKKWLVDDPTESKMIVTIGPKK